MKRLLAILCLIPVLVYSDPNPHKVHFVYLIPTDKTPVNEEAITNAALHLQAWYQWQMGNEKTFTLNDPVVEVYYTSRDSAWYSETPCCLPYYLDPFENWWWDNVLIEAHEQTLDPNAQNITGAWYCCEEFDDWVVYIESAAAPGQISGGGSNGGGYMGLAMLGDLMVYPRTTCRGIGGDGHEFGHTLGLGHPPEGDPDWPIAIMGLGYLSYPAAILRQADKDSLNANPFFDYMQPIQPPVGLCPLPTPLPAPHANNADHVQNTSFRARWNAVNGATDYHLDVATDSSFINFAYQDWNVGNVLNEIVSGLPRHTDYWYRVRSYNGIVNSQNSNVIHVKTK